MKPKICSICNKKYEGYGNNSKPLKDGFCCDKCNMIVINTRLKKIKLKESERR